MDFVEAHINGIPKLSSNDFYPSENTYSQKNPH